LCPGFQERIDLMLDAYLRLKVDVQDIQGIRDDGVDVLLRYRADDQEHLIGLQIKSYAEIEAARRKKVEGSGSLIQLLKAQYVQATESARVETWYLVLCTNQAKHRNTIRSICSEFKNFSKAKVILPRNALSFYQLQPSELIALVTN